ncbi:MAG TPA: galactose-1-phosphate uridylyltransferase [Desulfobacterales bacterium]|nr:galactose-1-phosphate uridylyltransferase [Desulfobacterales bacterium]
MENSQIKPARVSTGNEMRYNPVTGEWVIYATARRSRPDEMRPQTGVGPPASSYEPSCPFCPGNEHMLPGILLELGSDAGGWKVRVVPNRYPALTPEGDNAETAHGLYRVMKGTGRHEVIIESQSHDRPVGSLSPTEANFVIEAYHRRYRELSASPGIRTVFVFRNHGVRAGTSLAHPHSQLIATGLVPQSMRTRQRLALSHLKTSSRCLFCHMLEEEGLDGRRMLFQNEHFVSFVPYAAESPCEIYIVPKTHRADFGEISENEKSGLAEALQSALACLRAKLYDPDYNFVIHSALFADAIEASALHWHVQIQPRLTTPAGFEMGSGLRINPSLPEADAAFLRGR